MSTPEKNVPIALLTQSGEPGRHLREALAQAGTPIAYEAHAAHFDRDALEQSGARVIVVNLDPDVEAHLDEVYALLGDERYNVIFNEAQVSSQLSGWEQARWARHLAAKILGSTDADPPRPAGAQPVPQPTAPAIAAMPDEPVVPPVVDPAPSMPEVSIPEATQPVEDIAAALPLDAIDFSDLDQLFAEPPETAPSAPAVAAAPPALDLSEFDAPSIAVEIPEQSAVPAEPLTFDIDFESSEADASAHADSANDEALGFGDLDDFADGPDFSGTSEVAITLDESPLNLETEFAAAAGASAEAASGSNLSSLELLDLDWADAPQPPAVESDAGVPEEAAVPPPPPGLGSAFAWTLEDVDENPSEGPAGSPAAPAEFGIEKISAAEYLAPETDATGKAPAIDAGFSLELIPLDEAVAPQQSDSVVRESWLDPSTATVAVRRVWVLGASIGGPEAVREFLAEVPRDFPALFLLAQHMGAEFMELMAQQLVKTTALTVRTPTHGERVAHGDIVVVPTTHRLRVDSEGIVLLDAIGEPAPANSPSIDQLLHDVADRFGANAGVIVFSGMAEDAIEGSRYLAAKGGKVLVQDPQTCVISSMVDGVLETGVVQFTGSPRELAERLLGERRPPANS